MALKSIINGTTSKIPTDAIKYVWAIQTVSHFQCLCSKFLMLYSWSVEVLMCLTEMNSESVKRSVSWNPIRAGFWEATPILGLEPEIATRTSINVAVTFSPRFQAHRTKSRHLTIRYLCKIAKFAVWKSQTVYFMSTIYSIWSAVCIMKRPKPNFILRKSSEIFWVPAATKRRISHQRPN